MKLTDSASGQTTTLRVDGYGIDEWFREGGDGEWKKGRSAWGPLPAQPVAGAGAWTADDTFAARVCLTETPFVHAIKLKFAGSEVKYESEANVGFGATKAGPLTGAAK